MSSRADKRVILGRVGAPHGVQGWVRVMAYTEEPGTLAGYASLEVGTPARRLALQDSRLQRGTLLLKFAGIDDRDAAARLEGAELAVGRAELPPTAEGEYYWVDLIGLRVENLDGVELGRVERLMAMPAQTVLVVAGARERLVPLERGRTLREVDLAAGCIRVDWDADW